MGQLNGFSSPFIEERLYLLVDDDAIFFDDRSHDKFQIQPTKKLLLKHKDWYVVYMNSEFHNSPAEDEPILCVGIVKNIEDWKNR